MYTWYIDDAQGSPVGAVSSRLAAKIDSDTSKLKNFRTTRFQGKNSSRSAKISARLKFLFGVLYSIQYCGNSGIHYIRSPRSGSHQRYRSTAFSLPLLPVGHHSNRPTFSFLGPLFLPSPVQQDPRFLPLALHLFLLALVVDKQPPGIPPKNNRYPRIVPIPGTVPVDHWQPQR